MNSQAPATDLRLVTGAPDLPTTQTGRAAVMLRQMILDGVIPTGERLREIPLAEQLGVSRIPLRLALEQLAHEGLLELRPTRGFVVQQFSIADVDDSIVVRGALEGAAAQMAAERCTGPEDVARLRMLNGQLGEIVANEKMTHALMARYAELNLEWHDELLRRSCSRLIRRALEQNTALPFASPSAFPQHDLEAPSTLAGFRMGVEQHTEIANAIEARDRELAATLTRIHARIARMGFASALRVHREVGETPPSLRLLGLDDARKPVD